jgi:hypothetical protein
LLWFKLFIKILIFLIPATPNPKGWSMKHSIKPHFLKMEMGFLFWGGRLKEERRPLDGSKGDEMPEKLCTLRKNLPNYTKPIVVQQEQAPYERENL